MPARATRKVAETARSTTCAAAGWGIPIKARAGFGAWSLAPRWPGGDRIVVYCVETGEHPAFRQEIFWSNATHDPAGT